MELFQNFSVLNAEVYERDDADGTILSIDGDVIGSSWNEYHVSLEYNLDSDTFTAFQCECPAYQSSPGMCKHCAALALEYLSDWENDNPASDLQTGSSQPRLVRGLTTDSQILKLIKNYALQKRMREQKPIGNIEIIPELTECRRYNYNGE